MFCFISFSNVFDSTGETRFGCIPTYRGLHLTDSLERERERERERGGEREGERPAVALLLLLPFVMDALKAPYECVHPHTLGVVFVVALELTGLRYTSG